MSRRKSSKATYSYLARFAISNLLFIYSFVTDD
jgi:hypothetical protein